MRSSTAKPVRTVQTVVDYKSLSSRKDRVDWQIRDELFCKFGIKKEEIPEGVFGDYIVDWPSIVSLILNKTKYKLVSVTYEGGCKASGYNVYHFVAEWKRYVKKK